MTLTSTANAPHTRERSRGLSDVWSDRLAWLVLAVVAAIAALTFRDYGLGWDDFTHAQYGELMLQLYRSGFHDTRALSFVNLYLYGGGFDMLAAALAKILPFDLFETRRLLGAIVGIAGLALVWRIGRRVSGPLAGTIALLLCATCPLYYGHMFMNPKDAPFAVAMALFLLALVRLIEEYPEPGKATVAMLGAGFGLSIGSRIMAGFGVIEAVVAIGLLFAIEANRQGWRVSAARLGRLAIALIPAAILAYAVMAFIWPWSVVNPLNPVLAIETFAHFFEKPWQELFMGERLTPLEMPRSYVPVLMALRLPEIFLLLGGAGVLGMLIAITRPATAVRTRAIYAAIVLAGILPVLVTAIARPAMYNGIRHFVFIVPPLAVAGGIACAYLAGWIGRRAPLAARWGHLALGAAVAAGLSPTVLGMARLHPYEYVFFNHVAGGVEGAQSRYMLDYWGLALKQAGSALRQSVAGQAPSGDNRWKVAVCGPHPPARIALGGRFEPTWEIKDADFALMLGTFYCARLDAPVLAEIVRDGVVFARAYDIRGRNIRNMFTQPPVK